MPTAVFIAQLGTAASTSGLSSARPGAQQRSGTRTKTPHASYVRDTAQPPGMRRPTSARPAGISPPSTPGTCIWHDVHRAIVASAPRVPKPHYWARTPRRTLRIDPRRRRRVNADGTSTASLAVAAHRAAPASPAPQHRLWDAQKRGSRSRAPERTPPASCAAIRGEKIGRISPDFIGFSAASTEKCASPPRDASARGGFWHGTSLARSTSALDAFWRARRSRTVHVSQRAGGDRPSKHLDAVHGAPRAHPSASTVNVECVCDSSGTLTHRMRSMSMRSPPAPSNTPCAPGPGPVHKRAAGVPRASVSVRDAPGDDATAVVSSREVSAARRERLNYNVTGAHAHAHA
ncbi:hypothetical protein VTO73DRAFT_6443 [Trametes versicolor]